MPTVPRSFLEQKLVAILQAHNVQEEDAKIAACVLCEGSARGYLLHGVERIFHILEGFQKGSLNPQLKDVFLKETSSMAVIDAGGGLGAPSGTSAMALAIKKATQQGVGVVGVLNASHLGILAYYSEMASAQDCVGLVMTTSSPAVVVTGGKTKTFGTNPISYSFPAKPFPITADFSIAKTSRGRIYDALHKSEAIPLGWAVDENGQDTTDPEKALLGGLHTLDGDIKGSLLSMLVSVLAGPLIGGVMNPDVKGTRYMEHAPNKGDVFMALHVPTFSSLFGFEQKMERLEAFIEEQNASFRMPGQHSYRQREKPEIQISNDLSKLIEAF